MTFGGGDRKGPAVGGVFDRSEGKTHNGDGPSSAAPPAVGGAGVTHELGHALGLGHTLQRAELPTPAPAPAPAASSAHEYGSSLMAYPSSPFAGMY